MKVLWAALFGLAAALPQAATAAPVRACGAEVEFPPFLFNQQPGNLISSTGIVVDLLQLTMQQAGLPDAQIERLPWLRCLKLVESGIVDIALNVPTAQIDPKPYYITEPYSEVHSIYYYSTSKRPAGLHIKDLEDLKHLRICGLMGNRYESYGIDSSKVDTGATTYAAMVGKLNMGFCDVIVEKQEIIDSLMSRDKELAALFGANNLARKPLPEELPLGLHFAISRRSSKAQMLLNQLNATISNGRKSNLIEQIHNSYLSKPKK